MGHLIFWAAQFVNRKMYECPYSQNPDFRNATISVASCCTWTHPKTLRWPEIMHASCQNDLAHPYDTKYTVSQFVNPTYAHLHCSKIHIIVRKTESRSFSGKQHLEDKWTSTRPEILTSCGAVVAEAKFACQHPRHMVRCS